MSADNFLVVDHDGTEFIVSSGFASDDDGNLIEQGRAKTEIDVSSIIQNYGYTEYGVDWTPAARGACGRAVTDAALERLTNQVINLANKLEEHINTPDAHNPGVMRHRGTVTTRQTKV